MSAELKHRIAVERELVRLTVEIALKEGFWIGVANGADDEMPPRDDAEAILADMFQTDEEKIYLYRPEGLAHWGPDYPAYGWVYFVYGNSGWDVVCDYTTNLEDIMKPVFARAQELEDGAPLKAHAELLDLLEDVIRGDQFSNMKIILERVGHPELAKFWSTFRENVNAALVKNGRRRK
jgi:hypothetical protein